MILAGDIGGTKANLALFEGERGGRIGSPRDSETYRCHEFPTFEGLIDAYRKKHTAKVEIASFGVAGPVIDSHVKGTHLPWEIDAAKSSKALGIPTVHLLNDLAATAYGVASLDANQFVTLQEGEEDPESCAGLIAAGTGLGETFLVPTPTHRFPIPSEGGHADFAPRTDRELELFRVLRARFGRVSYERVVSGIGIENIAGWTHSTSDAAKAWKDHQAEAASQDLAAIVSLKALEHSCIWCSDALDLFVSAYGAEAGNLALRGVTRAGVYVGGGIAPKILPALRDGRFVEAFREKPPHIDLLTSIPIRVILEERTAVLGAARFATLGAD